MNITLRAGERFFINGAVTHELSARDRSAHPGEAAKAAGEAAQMSANILSAPVGAELDNGAVMFAGRKRT
jgi:hypothetical protein